MRAPNKANPKEAPKMTTQDGWFPRGFDIVKMPLATNAQMAFVKTTTYVSILREDTGGSLRKARGRRMRKARGRRMRKARGRII